MRHRKTTLPGTVTLVLALVVAACGGSTGSSSAPTGVTPTGVTPSQVASNLAGASPSSVAASPSTAAASPSFVAAPGALTLVAYSTPKAVYDAIIPLFQATPDGAGLQFETSYGGSGDQSRAVEAGPPLMSCLLTRSRYRPPGQGRDGRQHLEQHADEGHGQRQRRRLRRPQGQPQEHQDLG